MLVRNPFLIYVPADVISQLESRNQAASDKKQAGASHAVPLKQVKTEIVVPETGAATTVVQKKPALKPDSAVSTETNTASKTTDASKQTPSTAAAPKTDQVNTGEPKTAATPVTSPVKPAETVKEVPKKYVRPIVKPDTQGKNRSYTLIAGLHGSKRSALAKLYTLNLLDIPAKVESRGDRYIVVIGKYATEKAAMRAAKTYAQKGHQFEIIIDR